MIILILLLTLSVLFPKTVEANITDWQKSGTVNPASQTDFSSQNFKESLANLKATGANFVTLIIPYYQSSLQSTDITPGWNTPTDESLIAGINYAHTIGLKVMLKMHPEVTTNDWRGFIDPTDRDAWFAQYSAILNHYATLAKETGVEEICLGAELFKLTSPSSNATNTDYWVKMIADVRSRFSGLLTYSAQHTYPREAEEITFWDKLDFIGFAAYFSLGDDLNSSWGNYNNQVITPLAQKWGRPVLFTEIGYRSLEGSHRDPWDWGRTGEPDEAEQARAYEALFSYWASQPIFAGVHLWEWESDPQAGGPNNTKYTPQNKQAEGVMKTWFGGQAPTAGPTIEPSPFPTTEPTISPTVLPTAIPTVEPTSYPTLVPTVINNPPELSVIEAARYQEMIDAKRNALQEEVKQRQVITLARIQALLQFFYSVIQYQWPRSNLSAHL